MKAIIVQDNQDLVWQETFKPRLAEQDVLVDVHYAALNRADLMQRAGRYPVPRGESPILGLEMSGTISTLGSEVTGHKLGDEVCALLPGGGYAEQVKVPAAMLMPLPKNWTLEEASTLPEAFFTAYLNLFIEAGLEEGERVLIHAGASGVGTAAIQLAKAAGCEVISTAGSAEKVQHCQDVGADLAINYKEEDFAERIRDYTQGAGVQVILDVVGQDYFERNIDSLSHKGRMLLVGTLSGVDTTIDIRKIMVRHAMLKGSTLRPRPLEEKIRIKEAFMRAFWSQLESRDIKPVIDSVFPIQDAALAHEHMMANKNIGKILLKVKGAEVRS